MINPDSLTLYVVTDERSDAASLMPTLALAIQGGATAIQLRRKMELGRNFVELGRAIRQLTLAHDVLFFINDRVDVAKVVDADGVHIGQDDISCKDARGILPDKLIGVSAATLEEAREAQRGGADYLGVGALFPTSSKTDARSTTLHDFSQICQAVRIPVVGIGGINMSNAAAVATAGAAGVAVVSAVMSAADPMNAALTLKQTVLQAKQG